MIRVPRESRLSASTFARMEGVEFWVWRPLPEIPVQSDDITVTLDRPQRIDTLSQTYYGTPLLWWVIARANGLQVHLADLPLLVKVRIPSERFVREELPRLLQRDP